MGPFSLKDPSTQQIPPSDSESLELLEEEPLEELLEDPPIMGNTHPPRGTRLEQRP
jgi:hypothetical protein